jgi:hypothetical protein
MCGKGINMIVNICFDDNIQDVDIVDIPEEILKNIDGIQKDFLKWLFDKHNDHKYWVLDGNEKKYCEYRSEAFVEWINENLVKSLESKAIVIEKYANNINCNFPIICF